MGFQYYDFSVVEKLNWFGTVRGRVGYVAGPALLHFTGGLAYGEVERVATLGGTAFGSFNFAGKYDDKSTKVGWTIGGGIEGKLPGVWSAWTAKAEYLYVDLGNVSDTLREDYTQAPFLGGPGATRTVSSNFH